MDVSLILEYGWVILVLVALEGLLSADNALVLAIMVKHLPEEQKKKALFYGLMGAFVFRFASLFLISFLAKVWQIQAIGALYLIFISINHLFKAYMKKNKHALENKAGKKSPKKKSGFWMTVFKVEVADIAFAIDSILTAVALAAMVTPLGIGEIGGLDSGQFMVILAGGIIGLIIMRFAATYFVQLLQKRPGLETAAFVIVGWVGVKLAVATLAHEKIGVLSPDFSHSLPWKLTFYGVLVGIAILGWFLSPTKKVEEQTNLQKAQNI
ncbi:TerC family protein [Priestia taiwanensis]|uniref:Membrane protein n=1 Tax=Priestia taiwanensis TaxID=1347902 RepID=A0A917ASD8_9BACI|nr:TerC family protein [Priestia taiwanensis]MBM7364029.1 YkoY family integral membrane protein [Priestia taiwanensis]GGE71093.1 membrane protein [Priestia taiwanensis]